MSQLESLFDEFNQEELQQVVKKGGEKSSEKGKKGDKKTSEDTHNKSMLFVRGIPKDATNTELEEFFSEVGPIRSCFVVTEKKEPKEGEEGEEGEKAGEEGTAGDEKPQNRGFGFVQFVLAEDAQRAVEELVDTKFRGKKRLMLDFAMKKHMKDAPGVEKPPPRAPKRPRAAPAAGDKDGSDEPAEKKRKKAANNESRTVTIQGIPKGTTKKQLIKKVKKSGNVHSVFYPTPFEGASPEQLKDGAGGSANVTFDDHAAAQRAVRSLNDHIFKGAKLKVMMKRELVDKNARLIVRNLPFKVRERELERLFSESGTVLTVDLPRKFVGGPLRGFAFIQMADVDSAQRAISKWNDHSLYGRNISVSLAVAKDKFKEMEESGEIEKPEFAEEPVAMEVDEENEDAEDAEGAEDADGDADGEDIKDDLVEEGCTLFIRNLSFDSDEDSLFEHFRQFGKLRYCRVVYDHETGRSRGTAFVCFWNSADAANCLAAAQKAQELSEKLSSVPSATLPDQRNKSVLLQETPASLEATAQFSLDGRMLSVAKAVDRSTANTLTTEGIKQRQSKDKRNTYLLKEGVIFPDTPAAQALAPADLEHHVKEYGQRKNQILKNPNLYLSKTRLSVHNIPRTIDEKDLRAAAISAIS
ncbi:RNA recognition motif-containing protein, partial [Linderina macrospora]